MTHEDFDHLAAQAPPGGGDPGALNALHEKQAREHGQQGVQQMNPKEAMRMFMNDVKNNSHVPPNWKAEASILTSSPMNGRSSAKDLIDRKKQEFFERFVRSGAGQHLDPAKLHLYEANLAPELLPDNLRQREHNGTLKGTQIEVDNAAHKHDTSHSLVHAAEKTVKDAVVHEVKKIAGATVAFSPFG